MMLQVPTMTFSRLSPFAESMPAGGVMCSPCTRREGEIILSRRRGVSTGHSPLLVRYRPIGRICDGRRQ
jgi:hypothetical protein